MQTAVREDDNEEGLSEEEAEGVLSVLKKIFKTDEEEEAAEEQEEFEEEYEEQIEEKEEIAEENAEI